MKKKEQIKRARSKARIQAARVDSSTSAKRMDGRPRSENGSSSAKTGGRKDLDSEEFRREQAIKTAKWNRYMLIRYLDAGVFFAGLYWLYLLIALRPSAMVVGPLLEIALSLVVMIEVFGTLSREIEDLVWSRRALVASCVASGIVLCATVAGGETLFFPFFSGKTVGVMFCITLIAVKLVIIHRIDLVRDRRDKRYALYQKVLKYNG